MTPACTLSMMSWLRVTKEIWDLGFRAKYPTERQVHHKAYDRGEPAVSYR
jgi:hypothetical protein